jgi:hypothetical protein
VRRDTYTKHDEEVVSRCHPTVFWSHNFEAFGVAGMFLEHASEIFIYVVPTRVLDVAVTGKVSFVALVVLARGSIK